MWSEGEGARESEKAGRASKSGEGVSGEGVSANGARKRDLLRHQKRPTKASKQTYQSIKRDLLKHQKGV